MVLSLALNNELGHKYLNNAPRYKTYCADSKDFQPFPIAGKPGTCPPTPCLCTGPQPDECRDDYSCRGREKCCYYCCVPKCLETTHYVTVSVSGKPGVCPLFPMRCLIVNPPNKCIFDKDCPSNLKCCVGPCGRDCFQPLFGTINSKLLYYVLFIYSICYISSKEPSEDS
uniref:WAP domain-containing protein n=1 Tax=Podarcis muralis TaxID=64176 RepID=A0A670IL43_PODMU